MVKKRNPLRSISYEKFLELYSNNKNAYIMKEYKCCSATIQETRRFHGIAKKKGEGVNKEGFSPLI
jgi:hypothetical protein